MTRSKEEFFATAPRRMPTEGKRLTTKEVAVLRLVAQGLTNEQICRKLAYASGTVSTMLQRIRCKLGAANRAAAVDQGWRRGYLGKEEL